MTAIFITSYYSHMAMAGVLTVNSSKGNVLHICPISTIGRKRTLSRSSRVSTAVNIYSFLPLSIRHYVWSFPLWYRNDSQHSNPYPLFKWK